MSPPATAGAPGTEHPPATPSAADPGDQRVTLAIGGMTCAACARRIEKALQRAPGVTDAVVNLATHQATVIYAPDEASLATLVAAVVDAGYRATPPSEAAIADEARALTLRLIVAAVAGLPVLVLGMSHGALAVPGSHWVQLVLTSVVLVVAGAPIGRAAVGALRHGGADMNVLVTLGATAAFGASVLATVAPSVMGVHHGAAPVYYEAAVAIVGFVLLGRWLEARARRRAGAALGRLRALVPPTAAVLDADGVERKVALDRLAVGDRVVVRPGQAMPADGEVVEGASSVAEAVLTGEAMPVDKRVGDDVFAGTSNGWGRLVVRVTRAAGETSLATIAAAVEAAMGTRAPMARLADRVAGWMTPAVLLVAVATFAGWSIAGVALDVALLHAVAVLVVACPCALGLATPAALAVGLGRAAERGALFRSAAALERLGAIDTVVVDKTGTLTEGQPLLLAIALAPGAALDEVRLLALTAGAEEGSEHPLAGAVLRAAGARGIVVPAAAAFEAVPGRGVRATVDGRAIVAGSPRFVREAGIAVDDEALAVARDRAATPVAVAVDGVLAGVLAIGDAPREGAAAVVRALGAAGIEVVMLSGDGRGPAEAVAAALGITRVEAEALPADKAARIAALRAEGRQVAMVGDGVNDAPALAAADVGVAMGSATDVAAASAEVVLLRDDLGALAAAVHVARRTRRVVRENLVWALGYNVLMIPAAAGALIPLGGPALSPMLASAAMAGSSLAVVANSLRLRRA